MNTEVFFIWYYRIVKRNKQLSQKLLVGCNDTHFPISTMSNKYLYAHTLYCITVYNIIQKTYTNH